MLSKFSNSLFALVLLFFSTASHGQISISYSNPTSIKVCDGGSFEISLKAGNNPSTDITVDLLFPNGINYVAGSVTNVSEEDISDLNHPIFSVPNMGAGEEVTFTLRGGINCSIINDINNGKIFANTITANFDGQSERQITFPYIVETGLLVITELDPVNASGQSGDEIIRRIKVTNTRLGSIENFRFTDVHGGALIISSNGNNVINTTNRHTATFDRTHFSTIGNFDNIFDEGEEFIIEERIIVNGCGDFQTFSNSFLTVDWGCNNEICQSTTRPASVIIEEFDRFSSLDFREEFNIGEDFCTDGTYEQTFFISNDGNNIIQNLVIILDDLDPADPSTIETTLDNVPQDSSLTLVTRFNSSVNCTLPNTLYKTFRIDIPLLEPNQTVAIKWQSTSCDNSCGGNLPSFTYDYRFDQFCLPPDVNDDPVMLFGATTGSLLKDSISFFIGEYVKDAQRYELRYDLLSDILLDTAGIIDINFNLPCGFAFSNIPLVLDGQQPISTEITDLSDGQLVNLQYQLPFSSDHVWGNFFVDYVCNSPCNVLDSLDGRRIISSCFDNLSLNGTPINARGIKRFRLGFIVESNYIPPGTTQSCQNSDCERFDLDIECIVPATGSDFLSPGHLEYSGDFARANYGFQDNDDDRIMDNFNPADLSLVRTDRVMTGDTGTASIEGIVIADIDQTTFPVLNISVQFEGHTIDDGIGDGSAVNIRTDRELFDSEDGFAALGGNITVKDADTGAEYTCDVDARLLREKVFRDIDLVNTRPPLILDEWYEISYLFEINLEELHLLGCNFPQGFRLAEGDSVFFESDYHFAANPELRVLNLRNIITASISTATSTTVGATSIACGRFEKLFQLSGYQVLRGISNFNYDPCEAFEEEVGSIFRIALGMPNFFPFEFRPLMRVNEWNLDLEGRFDLINSKIVNMGLVGSGSLFSDVPLPIQRDGNTFIQDLSSFQDPPFDEGFFFNLFHEFAPNPEVCSFQDATDLTVFTHNDVFVEITTVDPIDTTISSLGFIPIIPNLILTSPQPNTFSTNRETNWDFALENRSRNNGGRNLWMHLSSPSGRLTNFTLRDANGQILTPVNDLYQLGGVVPEEIKDFQLSTDVASCGLDSIQISYGWNCEPLASINAFTCLRDTNFLYVTAPLPELEMEISSPNAPVNLCDTIPYHLVEIFNADLGTAFDLSLQILMPLGMEILPGTAQIAYATATGNFQDIPDPINRGNGNYLWNINDIQSTIRDNGLPGTLDEPNNSFVIRFLSFANCGSLGSVPPFFTISGSNTCDQPTNLLVKPGESINVRGVTPSYSSIISVNGNAATNCGDQLDLQVEIRASGITEVGDSILITLPSGASYVANSYQNIQNASAAQPIIQNRGGLALLKWPIPPGIQNGSSILFSFSSFGYGNTSCEDEEIRVQTIQAQEATCQETNLQCPVLVETGNTNIPVDIQYPEWKFANFTAAPGGSGLDYQISGLNIGSLNSNDFTINFYIDADGDGVVSSDDIFLGEKLVDARSINNSSFATTGNLTMNVANVCNVIAVISPENDCNCGTDIIRIEAETIIIQELSTCNGESVNIGVDETPGANYFWNTPQNLSCTNCALTELTASNFSDSIQTIRYILIEEGNNCPKQYIYDVEILPDSKIITPDQVICAGEEVVLEVNAGLSLTWNGPGITDPTERNPRLFPNQNSIYTVEVNNGNCSNRDTLEIEVLQSPIANAGNDIAFCDSIGSNVQLTADVNPDYTYFWQPSHLLDDFLIPNPTLLTSQSSIFTLTVTNRLTGCSATDSVQVFFEETPDLVTSRDLNICAGETVDLLVNGAINYNWSPFSTLDCGDCQTVSASPTTTTTYVVMGSNAENCSTLDSITVFVDGFVKFSEDTIIGCMGEPIIFNGISYNNDIILDTILKSRIDGCDSIVTTVLNFIETSFEIDTTICEGDSILINGIFETTTGNYEEIVEINGCTSELLYNLTVESLPQIALDATFNVERGDSVSIVLQDIYDRYQWSPATGLSCSTCSSVRAAPSSDIVYTVTAFNNNGCSVQARTNVQVFNECNADNVTLPNIFSPNNDGSNDSFEPIDIGLEEILSVKIFNRWGQMVYESSNPEASWNGTFKGTPQPAGVYVYKVDVGCPENTQEKIGDITLVR